MQVEQADFLAVPTRDVSRAVAFYTDVPGLPAREHSGGEMKTPNVTPSFWSPEPAGPAGARVLGVEDTGLCHPAFARDPEGNTVVLRRRYSPRG